MSSRLLAGLASLAAGVGLMVVPASSAAASDAELDPHFGVAGIAVSELSAGSEGDEVLAAAARSDGSLYVAGRSNLPDGGGEPQPLLARIASAGYVASEFLSYARDAPDVTEWVDVVAAPDGGAYALGWSEGKRWTVGRFEGGGLPDRAFSEDGYAQGPAGSTSSQVPEGFVLLLQDDGKVVVVGLGCQPGLEETGQAGCADLLVQRLLPDGAADLAYGDRGVARLPLGVPAWMRSSGVSTGTAQPTGGALYKPVDPVSRQAMAAFLQRFDGLTG